MSEAPNFYERLAAARADFNASADFKKIKSDGLRFAYLPVEAAKPLIEECTARHGITILPIKYQILPDLTSRTDRDNGYGRTTSWLYMTALVTFRIAGADDYIDLEIMAEAQDNSDKCVNKVYTMAYKNLIKIVFGFSESGKDDSKFDDPRQQDNDFNQQVTERRVPPAKDTGKVDRFFGSPAKKKEGGA